MPTSAPTDQDILQLVYRQARGLGLSREDAQDCAQEFLLRLLSHPSAHRESPSWLHRCIHNFACNYLRGIVRRRATEQRAADSGHVRGARTGLVPSAQPGPRTIVMQKDFTTQIRSLLTQFTADQQDLFVRYHLRNQDLSRLAARQGRSLHALQQSLYSMHKRLARLLIERGWSENDARQLFVPRAPQPIQQSHFRKM